MHSLGCLWSSAARVVRMFDPVMVVLAVAFGVSAARQLIVVRRDPHRPGPRYLLIALTSLTASVLSFTQAANTWLTATTGKVNIPEPIGRTAVLVASWAVVVMFQHVTSPDGAPPRAGRELRVLVAAVVGIWLLFVLSPASSPLHSLDRGHPPDDWMIAYLMVNLGFVAWALTHVVISSGRYGPETAGPLRAGLSLVRAGALLGLGYVVVKAIAVLYLARTGRREDAVFGATIARGLAISGGLLIAAGCVIPGLARTRHRPDGRTARVAAWWWTYRTHRQLGPLWRQLHEAMPEIALNAPRGRLVDGLDPRRVQMRLYRRLVELRDALLELTPFLSSSELEAQVAGAAAGSEDEATAKAAALGHKLREVLDSFDAKSKVRDPAIHWFTLDLTGRDEAHWWLTVASNWQESAAQRAGEPQSSLSGRKP